MIEKSEKITSIKDSRVIAARSLSTSAGRLAAGKCLIPGDEAIRWAIRAGAVFEHVFFDGSQANHPLLDLLRAQAIECLSVSEGILKKISETHYLIPFLGVARVQTGEMDSSNDFVLVMDGVIDHGNIGTILRTARGFGIRDILSTQAEFDLFYKKTIDASRGAVFEVNLKKADSPAEAVTYLRSHGYQIVATSPHACQPQSLARLRPQPVALVVGNETNGISEEMLKAADLLVQIPMSSALESLNVAVAAGISIYEFKLKMVLAMLIHNIRSTLGREVNVTGKLIQQVLDTHLKGAGNINSTQLILLMVMKCDAKMTRAEISKDTACFGEELELLLRPLLDSRWIEAVAGESEDVYSLTGKGEDLLGSLWGIIESSEQKLLQGFSESEIRLLKDFMQRLQENAIQLLSSGRQAEE